MKKAKGISLIALVLTIIVMVILTGITIRTIIGENGIFSGTINSVEQGKIATDKEQIELSMIEIMSENKKLTIDSIVDKLVEKEITTEENSNRDTNQVKTENGYIFEIDKNENNNWEVKYIGKGTLAKTELEIKLEKDINVLTTRLTVTLTAKADSGIAKYTDPGGETKRYEGKQTTIEETYEISQNGTYTFTVENKKGKKETKSIEINNILEGTIAIDANTTEATNEDVIVTVVWPNGSEQGIKEIKVGEGDWQTYEGESSQVAVKQNCTLKARVTSDIGEVAATSLTIINIDKLAPNTFTPTATSTSNSITISGSTTDQAATSTNASSGIIAYYFQIDGGEWKTNTDKTATSYTFTGLTQGTSHTLKMKAVDKAGNETITNSISKTTTSIAGGDDVIKIVPSTSEPTNQNITVSVTWPSYTEGWTKEISINGGSTWSTYTSAVTISGNCTVKARLKDTTNQTGSVSSVTIANIDKLAPNTFTPTATSTSNSITLSGSTTDQAATSTNASSGIKGYYYSKDNGGTWQNNTTLTNSTYTYTGLTQGTSYTLKMKAVDNAGNETVVNIGSKTTTSIASLGNITITPSKTTPTNQDITVSVTWPSDTTGYTKKISTNNGSTWSEYTGAVTISANCVVKARLFDSTEQYGQTATCEITNIDKTNPTVTAKTATVTITEGDSHSLGEYFTITANGTYGIASTVYTDTSNGNAVVSNTNTLAVGTHTIKCTVTKETGASANASVTIVVEKAGDSAADIASKLTEYCGGIVSNYTTPSGDPNVKWKIFYADSSNIYLIASDYINGNYAPNGRGGSAIYKHSDYRLSFDNVKNDYAGSASILNTSITDSRVVKWISYVSGNKTSTNNNIKSVAYMLDTNIWSVYKNSSYADYAIGGPTLDMFVASYNQRHPDLNIGYTYHATGYTIGIGGENSLPAIKGLDNTDSTYVISSTNKAYGMWFAAPSENNSNLAMHVLYEGAIYSDYDSSIFGLRPLVCLKSGVKLTKQADGTYLISI